MEIVLFFYFNLVVRTSASYYNVVLNFFNMLLVCNEELKFYHQWFDLYIDAKN